MSSFPARNLLDGLANYLPVWAAERKTNIVVDQSNLSIRGQTRRTIEFWLDNSLIAAALRITYPGTGRNLAFMMQSPDGTPHAIFDQLQRERSCPMCCSGGCTNYRNPWTRALHLRCQEYGRAPR